MAFETNNLGVYLSIRKGVLLANKLISISFKYLETLLRKRVARQRAAPSLAISQTRDAKESTQGKSISIPVMPPFSFDTLIMCTQL